MARRAKKAGIHCIALCGCTGDGYEKIMECGVTKVRTLAGDGVTPEYAMTHAEEVYYARALELMRDLS